MQRIQTRIKNLLAILFGRDHRFIGRDHRFIGRDPFFPIHIKRVRPGMRSQMCRIHRKRLILVLDVQIFAQGTSVDCFSRGFISPVFVELNIPPPFFNIIQSTSTHHVIKLCQGLSKLWNTGGRPSERGFAKRDLPNSKGRFSYNARTSHRPRSLFYMWRISDCLISISHNR